MNYKILVVEDQEEISNIVAKYIINEGYSCLVAKDGFVALDYFSKHEFHLILLDVMMPGIDGFEVLKEIRKISEIPIIMLTAKQSEIDRLNGFSVGADDYVVKPFSVRELMSRIKAILKRVYKSSNEIVYTHEELSLHIKSMKLFKNEQEIEITASEYSLLYALFSNKNQVLTREQLINLAFGADYEDYDRNIDSYIKRIRQKIEDDPKYPKLLITKYGAGYIFGGKKV
ncbi:MAG: DNA-binding response regulator [Alkaliphilus sp.]|nr:MAG: DNA-binding response regulator [Alkaliphilus sp.]